MLHSFGSAEVFPLDGDCISGQRKSDGGNRRGRTLPRAIGNKSVLEVYLVGKVLKRVALEGIEFFICQRWLQYFHFGSGRLLGVRRPDAALLSVAPDRGQSGVRPPHSKEALLELDRNGRDRVWR